jgi:hypothetical protein
MTLITHQQHIDALPHNGLELAEESLLDDLAILQGNDLPTRDTAACLLMTHTRLTEEQDEDNS